MREEAISQRADRRGPAQGESQSQPGGKESLRSYNDSVASKPCIDVLRFYIRHHAIAVSVDKVHNLGRARTPWAIINKHVYLSDSFVIDGKTLWRLYAKRIDAIAIKVDLEMLGLGDFEYLIFWSR